MQVKLLRALQEKKIRRVGSTDEVEVDVRVISATNVPLETLVAEKRFREDLFYRLQVIPIRTPPLRERRDDIPLLAAHFLEKFGAEMGKRVAKISEEAMGLLVRHSWPGNVRELENVIERAVALETTAVVLPERLPDALRAPARSVGGPSAVLGPPFRLDAHVAEIERELLHRALQEADGDRAAAAELLGVSPRAFRYLLQKYKSSTESSPPGE
jgi:two-component system response regulator PilR (NtrC family)